MSDFQEMFEDTKDTIRRLRSEISDWEESDDQNCDDYDELLLTLEEFEEMLELMQPGALQDMNNEDWAF